MAIAEQRGLVYDDLLAFPDDGFRRELLDGVLYVSPPPVWRHQDVVGKLLIRLHAYAAEHGGLALMAPVGVRIAPPRYVEPDVLYLSAERLARLSVDDHLIEFAPDLVAEVTSQTGRRYDLGPKRAFYEAVGVREYWVADLHGAEVRVFTTHTAGYGEPTVHHRGDVVRSTALAGLEIAVDEVFALPF
jgi:Uma2 family endonuclease